MRTRRIHLLQLGTVKQEGPSIEATEEPRLGCLSSLGSQTKGGLGDRFMGLAWDKWPNLIIPLIASLGVPLEFRGCVLVGEEREEEGKGSGKGWGELSPGSFVLRLFSPSQA